MEESGRAELDTPPFAKSAKGRAPGVVALGLLEFVTGEEVADFEGGGVFGVGAVDGVFADRASELLADGSLFGLGRVGGAHELAEVGDGVVFFEDHGIDDAGAHEISEFAEEAALGVDVVEALGLLLGEDDLFDGEELEADLGDLGEDGGGVALADGVRLDDAKGTL